MNRIEAMATIPDTWITLYADGTVKVRTRNMDATSKRRGAIPFREFKYKPKLKSDRQAILRLIGHINLTSAGYEGKACLP